MEPYRKGVDVDCMKLKYLFIEFGFTVLAYKDLTKDVSFFFILYEKIIKYICIAIGKLEIFFYNEVKGRVERVDQMYFLCTVGRREISIIVLILLA